jgi:hypothetical protein
MTKIVVPYGAWVSPVSVELMTGAAIGLSGVRVDGQDLYWLEARPSENGRTVLCRRRRLSKRRLFHLSTLSVGIIMADFKIRMLNSYSTAVGISALTERAQKDRRIEAGYTLAFKSPGDTRPYVEAAEKDGFTFTGKELIGLT